VKTTENSKSVTEVLSFLNIKGVKYKVCHFSLSYTEEEIDQEISRLGMGLLEAVPLDVQGKGLILAITPSCLALDFSEFSKLLAPRVIRMAARSEILQRFPFIHPTNTIPPLCGLFGMECFLSPLIEKYHTIGLFVCPRNTLITMEASEFRRIVFTTSSIPVPTRPRYRAYASPGRRANDNCILGVSLESADFHITKLITITDWIRNHHSHCVVMLGDGLHRITLQLDSDVPEDEALEHSKWLARDFVHSQLAVFTLKESDCRFDFKFCSEIQSTHCYSGYYSQLCSLFHDDKEFQDSCSAFAHQFLQRKPQRQENSGKHVEMSCRYLLEELAVICCLARDFPCSFVYPGSLTILEEIAQGKHAGVPECLLNIDYVELKLKSRHKQEE
jgi:tRNA-dependent cyclodipeptide synthase